MPKYREIANAQGSGRHAGLRERVGPRVLAIVGSFLLVGCSITLHEDSKVLDALVHISTSIDALPRGSAGQQQAPKLPQHVVCRLNERGEHVLWPVEKLEKDEKDLGAVAACPAPNDYAVCIGGEPQSNVIAKCAAGKIAVGEAKAAAVPAPSSVPAPASSAH